MGNTEETKGKFSIKRERYKDGHYYSVGRIDGKRVKWKRWHGRQTTEEIYASERIIVRKIDVKPKEFHYRKAPTSGFKDFPRDHKGSVEKYKIIFKVTAGDAGVWFAVKQSPKPKLTDKEIKAIEAELIDSYHPQSASGVYDARITDFRPVICKNLLDGSKVHFT